MDAIRQCARKLQDEADKLKSEHEAASGQEYRDKGDGKQPEWNMVQWVNSTTTASRITKEIAEVLCEALGDAKYEANPYIVQAFGKLGSKNMLLQLLTGDTGELGARLLDKLATTIFEAMVEIERAAAATAHELNAKFSSEASGCLAFGKMATFYEGLDSLVGLPSARPLETMTAEHCDAVDSRKKWTTGNYGITTAPEIEWYFVYNPTDGLKKFKLQEWPKETKNCGDNRGHCRQPVPLEVVTEEVNQQVQHKLKNFGEPEMLLEEVIGARLYTGPMFEKYNAVTRGGALSVEQIDSMKERFKELCLGNRYTTTIHVINSALIKLAKLTKLEDAAKVFRGVTGRRLPAEFWNKDEFGVSGGVEFGFLSATRERQVAVGYATTEGKVSILLEFLLGAIDRGADLEVVSQYPHEKEVCFPPLTNLGVIGTRVERDFLVVEIGINVNHGAMTIDKVLNKNKVLVAEMCKNLKTQVDLDLSGAGPDFEDIQDLAHKSLKHITEQPHQAFNDESKFRTLINRALDVKKMVLQAKNLKSMEERFGRTHMTTLGSYQNLGALLQSMGHYEKSKNYLSQSLMRFEHVLKPTDPIVLNAQCALGRLMEVMAKYDEAEPLLRKALHGFRKAFGDSHPSTLEALNAFGSVQLKRGKYSMARLLFEKALDSGEKAFGSIHPEALKAADNLGSTETKMGHHEAAIDLHRRAQEGRDATLGPVHQDTLESVYKLGLSLAEAGKLTESIELLQRAKKGREDSLGDDHLDTLDSLDGLGKVYRKMQNLEKSKECLEKALRGREKVLGKSHHKTLKTVGSLATVFARLKKSDEAGAHFRRAYDGLRETLGERHPDFLKAGTSLGGHLADLEKQKPGGEEILRQVVELNRTALPEDHTDALYAMERLAGVYVSQCKFEEAERLLVKVLDGRESTEGPVHPNTLKTRSSLAELHLALKRFDDAELHTRRSLSGFESISGVDDFKTEKACKLRCRLLRATQKNTEAERLENRSGIVEDDVLLGSLNCLGEGYNPVEFLTNDTEFLKGYNMMENKATSMTWLEMETSCQAVISQLRSPHLMEALHKLKVHCKDDVVGEVWSFFTEEVLKNDNKLLGNRLNMLILGMQTSTDNSKLQWQLNDSSWCNEMAKLAEHEGCDNTYKKDANLFVWDLACNAVASSCVDQYSKICEASHLNPANFSKMAEGFLDAVDDAKVEHKIQQMPVLLGLQEWPRRDTEKGEAFRRVLQQKDFKITDATGVALAYSDPGGKLGEPTVVVNGEVDEQFVQDLLTRTGCSGQAEGGDDKAQKNLKALKAMLATTRKRVLAVSFEKVELVVIVVHAKEPKTANATAVLAEFICQIAAKFGSNAKWVAMADTNIATQKNAGVFVEELYHRDLMQVPMLTESTTAKRRSLLHGQCYDVKKSLKLVAAPKDKIISTPGSLRSVRIFPDLSDSTVLLPSPKWATDHALVTTVMDLNMLVPNSTEIRECSRVSLTGASPTSRQPDDLVRQGAIEEFKLLAPDGDGTISKGSAKQILLGIGGEERCVDAVLAEVPCQNGDRVHFERLINFLFEYA